MSRGNPISDRGASKLDDDLLTRTEVAALTAACPETLVGARNRVILTLAWRSGMRCSEVLDLRVRDLDLHEQTIIVRRGKGGKRRVLGLDLETVDVLRDWLDVCSPTSGDSLVFATRTGRRIDGSYVRHLLPRLALSAGVSKRVHLHGLRHRFAVELEQEGAPLSVIRDLLGHSSIATTDTYLRRGGATRAVAFARERAWSVPDGA
jgi:site-specific recombinase XerD